MVGEYAILWAKTYKVNEFSMPSIKEVVMGVYELLMVKVEATFKFIAKYNP